MSGSLGSGNEEVIGYGNCTIAISVKGQHLNLHEL